MKANKSGALAAPSTLADVDALLKQADAIRAQAEAARDGIKAKNEADIKTEVESLRTRVSKILGRDVNAGELLPIVSATLKGTPLFRPSGNPGNTAQLTDAKRDEVRAALKARAAALKMGQPAKPISVIARELGVTDQTAANYKPSKADVDAMPGEHEVPANAYASAA